MTNAIDTALSTFLANITSAFESASSTSSTSGTAAADTESGSSGSTGSSGSSSSASNSGGSSASAPISINYYPPAMAAQFTSIQSQLTALQTAITKNAINGGASGAAGGTSSQTSTTTNSTTSATDTQLAQAITNQTKAMQQNLAFVSAEQIGGALGVLHQLCGCVG